MTDPWLDRVLPCGRCYQAAVEWVPHEGRLECRNCGAPHTFFPIESWETLMEHNEWAALAAQGPLNARSQIMPKVGNKEYSYTAAGEKAAKKQAQKTGQAVKHAKPAKKGKS